MLRNSAMPGEFPERSSTGVLLKRLQCGFRVQGEILGAILSLKKTYHG
jgi:hypothetical protein